MPETKIKSKEIDNVLFLTSLGNSQPGSVHLHSAATDNLTKKVKEVKQDWNIVMEQVSIIVSDTDIKMSKSGFALDEITVGLGFNAKGKLGFIAEAGVEASIEIKFKRGK